MPNKEFLDYYIEHTDKRFEKVHEKLDTLLRFRWMLIGAALAISGTVSVLFEVAKAFAHVR
jgi:hypothetical protein